jgi:tryptophanyl-tRNA synthetase
MQISEIRYDRRCDSNRVPSSARSTSSTPFICTIMSSIPPLGLTLDPTAPTSAPAHPSSSAPAIKPASAADAHDQVVTPWDVQGSVSTDGKQLAIDYDKLIDQFGTRRLDAAILERFERLTGHRPHIFLRRGMFFSHRCVWFSFC